VVLGAGPAHSLYFAAYEMTKELTAKFTSVRNLNYGKVFMFSCTEGLLIKPI